MTHMVIVNTAAEKSFHPCDGIESAIATIERFRNEDNVESCELFELNPISFEFKPYYHVALSTGSAGSVPGVASAASVPSAAVADIGSVSAPIAEAPVAAAPDFASSLTSLSETPAPVAEPEVSVPVLSAVESPNPFDAATGTPVAAAPASLSDAFVAPAAEPASPFGFADEGTFGEAAAAPSALDATLADVGVPTNAPIPPLPEAIPPAPAFGEAIADPISTAAVADPFAQSPSDAAVATGFDPVDESATSSISDLFDSGAELPPPPPPPFEGGEVDEQPRRGLFGR